MSRLVVALDVPDADEAERVVDELYDLDPIFKIGLEALLGYADRILQYCRTRDVRCFIDAKLHDIPRTAGAAARQLVHPSVHILTMHALGGVEMMRAVVDGVRERSQELGIGSPHVFAVTLLTSIAPDDLGELGLTGSPGENVMRLAALARDSGCAGVVCGARDVRELKAFFGDDFLTLTPGIRPIGTDHGDQRRAATPVEAVAAGADYLVVGRPILEAEDRHAAAVAILDEMAVKK